MASLIPGFEYDIFISYRQKDNKGNRWVSEFVEALKTELESTFKEDISIYFDINPHDGLLETHDVDASLKDKLKCLVFIPIISRTYCDPKSFAWEHEFKAFVEQASEDQYGLKVKLHNGNVAGRVLPVRIHDLDTDDIELCESLLGGVLRGIEFIYAEPGVNRPLNPDDDEKINLNRTRYRNQTNKVGNAIKDIILGLKKQSEKIPEQIITGEPGNPPDRERRNILLSLWKRGVPQLTAGYFITSWVIIRFIDWILSRYNLPDHMADAMLIILTAMIPSVLLYIYNRERINQGKLSFTEKITFPSNMLITALLVVFVSGGTDLRAMTETRTVVDEFGEKETRKILKENYITKLSLYPFINEKNDSTGKWLQYGIFDAIGEDLFQFNFISPGSNSYATHLQEQIKHAQTYNYTYLLTGAFVISDDIFEITSRLYQASSGKVKAERIFKGSDFFALIDSITIHAMIDMDIPEKILNSFSDLPAKEQITYNIQAFRSYIEGWYPEDLPTSVVIKNLNKAIEMDSTFALASFVLADFIHLFELSNESARKVIDRAMRHRQRLSENRQLSTRILYYSIHGDNDKAVNLAEMQYNIQPYNTRVLTDLADIYQENFMINEYEKVILELNRLVPDLPDYMTRLAGSYLITGNPDKGLTIAEKLLNADPENIDALILKGEIFLHKNNLDAAEDMFQKAILLNPEDEKKWSRIFEHIDFVRDNPVEIDSLEPFTGRYKFEETEMNCDFFIHNNHLMVKAKNQRPVWQYPVCDTQFFSFLGSSESATFTFIRNKKNKVIKVVLDQSNISIDAILWKEDSLIIKARNLFEAGTLSDALSAFREAYTNNPDHVYLANYIKHLELVQSSEYRRIKPVLDAYTGEYNGRKIFCENDKFFYLTSYGSTHRIIPLSETLFMFAGDCDQIKIIKERDSVTGFKMLHLSSGKEEFYPKTE